MSNYRIVPSLALHTGPSHRRDRSNALRGFLVLLALTWAWAAFGETHHVTIRNGSEETIRSIAMGTSGSGRVGSNRLISRHLPPGATARIAYSQGCLADLAIGYASGRFENHPGVEICSDPHIVTGSGVAAPSGTFAPTSASAAPAPKVNRAPLPIVPPWTGKSITKRFGGME